MDDFLEVLIRGNLRRSRTLGGGSPGLGIFDFFDSADGDIDGLPVHVDDIVALLAIGLFQDVYKRQVLNQPLEKGNYPNAVLQYSCFKMDSEKTPLNRAETKLTLRVK